MKTETKGIVIFALGHLNYYRMAEILAASLIVNGSREDGIEIAAICDDEKKFVNPALFDRKIILPDSKYRDQDGKIVFNKATVQVYDLSPFDVTMKLDADMVWLSGRKPIDLFNSLENVDLTFENTGHVALKEAERKQSVWAEACEIQEVYGFKGDERLYTIFGEFLYFKKTKENKSFFSKVKSIYRKEKVKCAGFSNGTFTDELAMQIAIMKTGKYPHQDKFTPVYNLFLRGVSYRDKYAYQLPKEFYAYSVGGNQTPGWQKQQYNNLANHYFTTLGLRNPYQATDKKRYLPERQKL